MVKGAHVYCAECGEDLGNPDNAETRKSISYHRRDGFIKPHCHACAYADGDMCDLCPWRKEKGSG